ncbi:MAG: hypothetical protein K0R50_1551 [Eubacterium sp.]|jgi:hypothetical protein|nr:hypothetical protein [Eubacterium sp.]
MTIVKKDYKTISKTLQTGDIVLFSGSGGISKIIEKFENTSWSHVGMIVLPDDIKPEIECENKPLLWQSSPKLNIKEVQNKPESSGPELVYFDELLKLLKDYKYTVAIRRLYTSRTEPMIGKLNNFISKVHMDGFPSIHRLVIEFIEGNIKEKFIHALIKIVSLLKKIICLIKKGKAKSLTCKDEMYFCSELISQSYIEMGLLPKYEVSKSYSPKSFSTQGGISLLDGALLEDEIYITY